MSSTTSNQRAFVAKVSRVHASDVRKQVANSLSVNNTGFNCQTNSTSPVPSSESRNSSTAATNIVCNDTAESIDFEQCVSICRSAPELPLCVRSLIDFPSDDVRIETVPRSQRTVESTVPNSFDSDELDLHVRDCLSAYSSDYLVFKRKYAGLSSGYVYRSMCSDRGTSHLQLQQYECDVDLSSQKGSLSSNVQRDKINEKKAVTSDPLIYGIIDKTSAINLPSNRNANKHRSPDISQRSFYRPSVPLFSLFPLQNEDEVIERRYPAEMPCEIFGHRLLVQPTNLAFDFEFEPIFATMFLCDAKERKKISENFYFDLNSDSIKTMMKSHVPYQDISTLSRSAVFSITYPSNDLFLVIRLEKILQSGDISDAVEPYLNDNKNKDRLFNQAQEYCERLGGYRMPFAWTAVYLTSIFCGATSLERSEMLTASTVTALSLESNSDTESTVSLSGTLERRSQTSGASVYGGGSLRRTGSTGAAGLSRKGSLSAQRNSIALDCIETCMDSFRPITITINNLFKQESDKLSDEEIFKYLLEMKRPNHALSKKLKCIPGILKLDLSPAAVDELSNCLSVDLFRLQPYYQADARPIKEVLEFSPREIFYPNFIYRDLLYVYPKSANFSGHPGSSARNIAVKVELLHNEGHNCAMPVIFGKSSCPEFSNSAYTTVTYHNKCPVFCDEIKLRLPYNLNEQHHLLFTFYHISCKSKSSATAVDSSGCLETPIGYTWLPLYRNGELQSGEFSLPVSLDALPRSYSYLTPDVNLPNMRWLDNHKPMFHVCLEAISTVHTQDPYLSRFFQLYHAANEGKASCHDLELEIKRSVGDLMKARPEPLVKYLHILLDKLLSLMVNPPLANGQPINVGQSCFEMLGQMVKILTYLLDGFCDHHGRSSLLTSYIQYSCRLPHTMIRAKHLTAATSRANANFPRLHHSSSQPQTAPLSPGSRDLHDIIKCFERTSSVKYSMFEIASMPAYSKKLVHEELALHFAVSTGQAREMAIANAWFFLELLVKSMAEYLVISDRINLPRNMRFSEQFIDDIQILVSTFTSEIIARFTKDFRLAQSINTSLAFFLNDALSLMNRSFIFLQIRNYCKQVALKVQSLPESCNLILLKLEFLRIVCSHEHYISLNLPFTPPNLNLTTQPPLSKYSSGPPSPSLSQSSRSSGGSAALLSSSGDRNSINSVGAADLTYDFQYRHFLVGLVLRNLAFALESNNRTVQHKAINLLRNILTTHDADFRLLDKTIKCKIADLYLPTLGIVLDVYQLLFDPHAYKTTRVKFTDDGNGKNVAMAIAAVSTVSQGLFGLGNDDNGRSGGDKNSVLKHLKSIQLTLDSTRNLLACFCWVLKNLNQDNLKSWLSELVPARMMQMLDVLQICVSCFEYKGRYYCFDGTAITTSKSAEVLKLRLEESLRTDSLSRRDTMNISTTSSMPDTPVNAPSTPIASVRWRKEQIQMKQVFDYVDHCQVLENENDTITEGNLSTEISLLVIDCLHLVADVMERSDSYYQGSIMKGVLRVVLHSLSCNQSVTVLEKLFAVERHLVAKYPWLVLDEDPELMADLCLQLLRHCSCSLGEVRSQGSASLYLLMKQSFNQGMNFPLVKMMITVALSSLVGRGEWNFNEDYLRTSLKTILMYAEEDLGTCSADDTTFSEQVKDLVFNLHMILSDTVKMKESEHDFEMLMDLMYRIAKGYQNSPELRLTWLLSMAQKHSDKSNFAEAAHCLVHVAALVAEYLQMIESLDYLPVGCISFLPLSDNVVEEAAVSDDVIDPQEEGICESRYFTEYGLCSLVEQAAYSFNMAQMFEAQERCYDLVIPVYRKARNYSKLSELHSKMAESLAKIDCQRYDRRVYGTYFRVGFYGSRFGDLDGLEFVYKEPGITRLPEISSRLEAFYGERFGDQKLVEIIKDSNIVDRTKLKSEISYLQITYVEPYFDQWELRHRPKPFDQNYNIRRFVFSTPFTLDGRSHGELREQYKRKTVLTTTHSFPYIKSRIAVKEKEQIVLTPIEGAIEDIQKKTMELKLATERDDPKMLQMVLQGCIGTTVNQGPIEVANVFLADLTQPDAINGNHVISKHQNKLRLCFKDFSKKCADALKVNKHLIGPDQREYQKELERNYLKFTEKLAPMVATSLNIPLRHLTS